MQFRLRTLLVGITFFGVLLGILTAAPFTLALILFGGLFALAPAVLAAGIYYGDDTSRAFCIGGTAGGVVPLGASTAYFMYLGHHVAGPEWRQLLSHNAFDNFMGMTFAILLPLLFIAAGGYIGLRMRRAFLPAKTPPESEEPPRTRPGKPVLISDYRPDIET